MDAHPAKGQLEKLAFRTGRLLHYLIEWLELCSRSLFTRVAERVNKWMFIRAASSSYKYWTFSPWFRPCHFFCRLIRFHKYIRDGSIVGRCQLTSWIDSWWKFGCYSFWSASLHNKSTPIWDPHLSGSYNCSWSTATSAIQWVKWGLGWTLQLVKISRMSPLWWVWNIFFFKDCDDWNGLYDSFWWLGREEGPNIAETVHFAEARTCYCRLRSRWLRRQLRTAH